MFFVSAFHPGACSYLTRERFSSTTWSQRRWWALGWSCYGCLGYCFTPSGWRSPARPLKGNMWNRCVFVFLFLKMSLYALVLWAASFLFLQPQRFTCGLIVWLVFTESGLWVWIRRHVRLVPLRLLRHHGLQHHLSCHCAVRWVLLRPRTIHPLSALLTYKVSNEFYFILDVFFE